MSLPRHLPPGEPDADLLARFTQRDGIPQAVRRQAEFFIFFAQTIFPLLESYRGRFETVYTVDNGRPAWDPVRLLGVLVCSSSFAWLIDKQLRCACRGTLRHVSGRPTQQQLQSP